VVAALAVFATTAHARELIPFPSQQQEIRQQQRSSSTRPAAAPQQSYYVADFERSIAKMSCIQLKELRAKLSVSQRSAATPADGDYFGHLIGIIDQRRNTQKCPPA
jgi:hypothetical protein